MVKHDTDMPIGKGGTFGDDAAVKKIWSSPTFALALLIAINLFNYIDRYILAAVQPDIRKAFFGGDETPYTRQMIGFLATAFLVSYMIAAPIFGWLADRVSRWLLVGLGVIVWSLASGGSGLAPMFSLLLITRMFVGIGEAGYGPAAPTLISDLYPISKRGRMLAWFYLAIPVGSALGYTLGGVISRCCDWRVAFYAVVAPGIALGVLSLFMPEPPRGRSDAVKPRRAGARDYLALLKTPSYVLDTTGMAALTFAIGGISYWMPDYLLYRGAGDLGKVNIYFGAITVVAGIVATLLGGWAGDALRTRFSGSYFLVSGAAMFVACPLVVLMLYVPFPWCWGVIFLAVFFLFFNTGPTNAILANVTHPSIRASAFALNIFIIHAFGDAISPPLLGRIVGVDKVAQWNAAFIVVAAVMAVAAGLWMAGARYLGRDMKKIAGEAMNS